jgi:chorismate mutase
MTKNNSYLVIDRAVLPEIYDKVVYATSLLESGEASNTSEAVRMAGISRSVYYKYKDGVFPYQKKDSSGMVSMQVILQDKPGALMNLLQVFYSVNANILTVNQNIPVKGRAFVTISASAGEMTIEADELIDRLKSVDGVIKIDSIIG